MTERQARSSLEAEVGQGVVSMEGRVKRGEFSKPEAERV